MIFLPPPPAAQIQIESKPAKPAAPAGPAVYNSYVSEQVRTEILSESGIAFPGECFVLNGNDLFIWNIEKPLATVRTMKSSVPSSASRRAMAKYRNGTFWSQSQGKIFKFDQVLNRWSLVVEPDSAFNQFDVAPDGSVVLIGTSRKTTWSQRENPKPFIEIPFDFTTVDKGNLIEIWQPHGQSADKTTEYPEDFRKLASLVAGFGGFIRTWVIDDWLVLYSPDYGHLMLYNMISGSVSNLDVPWKSLNIDFVKAKGKGQKPWSIDYPKNGQPEHDIQIVPTNSIPEILYWDPYEASDELEKLSTRLKEKGVKIALTPPNGGPDLEKRWGRAELDLTERKVRFKEHFSRKDWKTSIWLDGNHQIVNFGKLTTSWLKAIEDRNRLSAETPSKETKGGQAPGSSGRAETRAPAKPAPINTNQGSPRKQ